MRKALKVYFKSENDATSARFRLQTLKVSGMYLEEMNEDTQTDLFIPIYPASIASRGMATNTATAAPLIPVDKRSDKTKKNVRSSHLLTFLIDEGDYHRMLQILSEFDCYHEKV